MTFRATRLAVIGTGLIGGSLARALRAAGACGEIVGCAPTRGELARARELGFIDRGETDAAAAARGADAVVLAVPVGALGAVFAAVAPVLGPDAVLTDVASVKQSVVAQARALLGARLPRYVPGHPIAGTERSGVDAGSADLFRGQRVVVTPLAETADDARDRVTALWQAAGARVEEMDPRRHDRILAATSHLPHVLAYTLVDCLAGMPDSEGAFRLAAGGFRDFTRIAQSNPAMWRDILLANTAELLAALDRYEAGLGDVRAALAAGDGDALLALFTRAQAAREAYAARAAAPGDA